MAFKVTHSGYLFRKSSIRKKYKNEWVKLRNGILTSFKTNDSDKASAVFDLKIFDEISTNVLSEKGIYKFRISSSSDGKSQEFSSSIEADIVKWIKHIEHFYKSLLPALTKGQKEKYLITGYIRSLSTANGIIDVIQSLIIEYCNSDRPEFNPFLIQYGQRMGYFMNEMDIFKYNDKLKFDGVICQHINDQYDIIYAVITGFQRLEWMGFLCIDKRTLQLYKLTTKKRQNNDMDVLNVMLSEELTYRSMEEEDGKKKIVTSFGSSHSGWLKPKNVSFDDDDFKGLNDLKINGVRYKEWTLFNDNLWYLFERHRLYDPNEKNIKKHQIWKVIQFLSLLHFENKHRKSLQVPDLILDGSDHELIYKHNTRHCKLSNEPGYENFRIARDCHAKIIKYKDAKLLRCKCFLSKDWGGSHWSIGGMDANLYRAKFQIRKKENKVVVIKLAFDVAMKYYKRGRRLS